MFRVSTRAAAVATFVLGVSCFNASAQTPSYSSQIYLPLIAETPSYQSTLYIHNPWSSAVNLTFQYAGATGSASPGNTTCPQIQVPANTVVKTSLSSLCPSLTPGSNFGLLFTNCCASNFAVYSRVQTPAGNGFSVEGMADGYYCCSPFVREVVGLTRQAAAPTFQTNCFIWNADQLRAGRLVVTLLSGDGHLIVDDLIDLQAGEFIRMLDVFAALNAPPGDYSNVRVTFESIIPVAGGNPVAYWAACTVQNSTSFDADFRIAKYHQ